MTINLPKQIVDSEMRKTESVTAKLIYMAVPVSEICLRYMMKQLNTFV